MRLALLVLLLVVIVNAGLIDSARGKVKEIVKDGYLGGKLKDALRKFKNILNNTSILQIRQSLRKFKKIP